MLQEYPPSCKYHLQRALEITRITTNAVNSHTKIPPKEISIEILLHPVPINTTYTYLSDCLRSLQTETADRDLINTIPKAQPRRLVLYTSTIRRPRY